MRNREDLYFKIKVGILWFLLIVCVIGLILAFYPFPPSKYSPDLSRYEWISPDGVHYWKFSDTGHGYLAPRYDNNGILIIENNSNAKCD